jgi:hypothetical protein
MNSGRISGYGICSNTLADPQAADHVSLPKIIEACAKRDNLVAVETPFNFFERQALVQPHGITVADISEKHQLFLMTNRPLTAIYQGQIRPFVNHTFGDGTAQGRGGGGMTTEEQDVVHSSYFVIVPNS